MSKLEFTSEDPNAAPAYTDIYADVAVPRAVPGLFTYRVPMLMQPHLLIGMRVVVQFGPRGVLTGVVHRIHGQAPLKGNAKDVLDILDLYPALTPNQLKLHGWMADYYLCTIGEVTNAALPAGLKISSESRVQLYPGFELELGLKLTARESELLDQLQRQESMSYDEVGGLLQTKSVYQTLKNLQALRAIVVYDQAYDKYTPKKERRVRLVANLLDDDAALTEASDLLHKAPRQYQILMAYLKEVPVWDNPAANEKGLTVQYLIQQTNSNDAAVKGLVQKGIMEQFELIIPRFSFGPVSSPYQPTLSGLQQEARQSILAGFDEQKPVLLHGITGSGKTEVYISLANDAISSGQQVLILLPEIALTAQMVDRLHAAFGEKLGVYHSRFSDNERVELWQQLQGGIIQVVLGVRSAIFLPFQDLGLIIVDEEHDTSYKQYDPNPRYNGRDVALVLGRFYDAAVLLGSGTPSIDSYYKAKTKQWHLVSLQERHGAALLPDISCIDLRTEVAADTMNGPFSSALLTKIDEVVAGKHQAILFQNRRGFAPLIVCQQCASCPGCPNCDVSLTYHQVQSQMRCHYCGHKENVPKTCHHCGASHLTTSGYGTEQLEELLIALRPNLRIRRMDQDTTQKKNSFNRLVKELEEDQVDVLIGTQMVSKGFDFKRVTMVGVFDTDRLMHLPNYRAKEQTYQLITQVAGRAGRHKTKGEVYIQTYNPALPLIQTIINHDYGQLYEAEITERASYAYPPFVWLIELTIRHADLATVIRSSQLLAERLGAKIGKHRVLGPAEPSVSKVRNYFLRTILIKLEKQGIKRDNVKKLIADVVKHHTTDLPNKGVWVSIDVDPVG
jgi:primosomal protein N' (replication factor Y)